MPQNYQPKPADFVIETLGKCTIESPLALSSVRGYGLSSFVAEKMSVLYHVTGESDEDFDVACRMERAGPRQRLYFDPEKTRAAIVTCGGLSPGLNNLIRSLLLELHHKYRIQAVIGFKYGFRGMNPEHGNEPVVLLPDRVRRIHNEGGSVLGVSRGAERVEVIVDRLQSMSINILFCVGGDGTLRGAHAIWEEIERRGAKISIVTVPKTIDTDIPFVYFFKNLAPEDFLRLLVRSQCLVCNSSVG
ncbi:MAG: 6-phosphofructokinase, partial [Proteobacteria bacterium]|nr:6-phosphofructokinase [Pseudomonadota bacterium]